MNCNIIRDLLPLYHDEVASTESRELVEEHLETCEECRKTLVEICESVGIANTPDLEQSMANGLKRIKKRLHRKTVFNFIIAIICATFSVSALTYGLFFHETPVPYSEVVQNITLPINSALDFITDNSGYNSIVVLQKDDALYICYLDTLWTRYVVKSSRHPQILLQKMVSSATMGAAIVPPALPVITTQGTYYAIIPEFIRDISELPEPPEPPEPAEPPEPTNSFIQISGITQVFYFECSFNFVRDLSRYTENDAAFSIVTANAVLLWEK